MHWLATGLLLGFMVSLPPGPNAALCVNLACGGARRAAPLITGAALADAAYSLLAASGVFLASSAGNEVLTYLAPLFMLGTAVLAWAPASLPAKAAIGVAFFNPATAAIWMSLSTVPGLQASSLPDLLVRPIPVAVGTALWFTLLALAAAKLSVRLQPRHMRRAQHLLASALGAMGVAGLLSTLI